jgi:aspartyl-tRNA(Asn)/glutamyl-tRNA(Gln) amidotransferase subunit A
MDRVLKALAGNPHNAVVQVCAPPDAVTAGPLSGMPVVIKDLIDVVGVPTRCGSAVLAEAPPVSQDAAVVAALRQAGAVVVAKAHTHEFGYGPTGDVAVQGPCRNPHDSQRITGGSSSGSAALVAAGVAPLAVGTDTGGSGRIPAALCGVVGLKPARGALPLTGVFPLAETLDQVALLGADIGTVGAAFSALSGSWIDPSFPIAGTVVGRPTDAYWRAHDPEITAAIERAADTLVAAGAAVREIGLPEIDDFAATYPVIVGAEAYATHQHWLDERPSDYQSFTAARLQAAGAYTAADYIAAQRTRRRLAATLNARLDAERIDLLLVPTTPLRATPIGARRVEAPDGAQVEVLPALLSLTLPFSLLGWAAVSVPAPRVPGLPAGIQLAAVRGGEQLVLATAARLAAPEIGARKISGVRNDEPVPDTPAPGRRRPR